MSIPDSKRSPAPGQREVLSAALTSRKTLIAGAVAILALVAVGIVHFWPVKPATVLPPQSSAEPELVQTDTVEWRNWRKQIHEKLSADKMTESVLGDALKIKLPARPEQAAPALRRDQAIGEVLMAYPQVRKLLWDRFGIDEHNFLGTGLSKPSSASNHYGAASVHEYLIKNHYAESRVIWTRTVDPINSEDMSKTIEELFLKDPKPDANKQVLKKGIEQRVKVKETDIPAVIRFARFNSGDYSHQLGPKHRRHVFASNLAEVWTTTLRDAAKLSGYISEKGDTVYVWIFLPDHSSEGGTGNLGPGAKPPADLVERNRQGLTHQAKPYRSERHAP